jgi:hypothetical protein
MRDTSLNVAGVRRLLNVSPAEMSDADIRRILVRWACELDGDEPPQETAANVRRFADAMNRLVPRP